MKQAKLLYDCVYTCSAYSSRHKASSLKQSFDGTPEDQGVLQLMKFHGESTVLNMCEMEICGNQQT